jgi:hypothetical protein
VSPQGRNRRSSLLANVLHEPARWFLRRSSAAVATCSTSSTHATSSRICLYAPFVGCSESVKRPERAEPDAQSKAKRRARSSSIGRRSRTRRAAVRSGVSQVKSFAARASSASYCPAPKRISRPFAPQMTSSPSRAIRMTKSPQPTVPHAQRPMRASRGVPAAIATGNEKKSSGSKPRPPSVSRMFSPSTRQRTAWSFDSGEGMTTRRNAEFTNRPTRERAGFRPQVRAVTATGLLPPSPWSES